MMKKVNSPDTLSKVLYAKRGSVADVWIRKNKKKLTDEENGTSYEYDEVFFTVPAGISEKEITADADFYFDQMADKEDGADAGFLGLEAYRAAKKAEIGLACENVIHAGIDVELSSGKEHFSLSQNDQINLFAKQAQLSAGADKAEYHEDGKPCRFYPAQDMLAIIEKALGFVSYQTTYCNCLNMWVKGCTKSSDIARITYGADIPEEYMSEVLRAYMGL